MYSAVPHNVILGENRLKREEELENNRQWRIKCREQSNDRIIWQWSNSICIKAIIAMIS